VALPHEDPCRPNEVHVSDEALRKAEAFIEAEEGAANKLAGWLHVLRHALCGGDVGVPPVHGLRIVPTQTLRPCTWASCCS
jgi:hypothetical protein